MSAPLASLVNKLVSSDDEVFESGLKEAVAFTRRGDEIGLQSIRAAIIRLSGQPNFTPYVPGVVMGTGDEFAKAESKLLQLASRGECLKDPRETQRLIANYKTVNNAQDFAQFIAEVNNNVSSKDAHALLLLSNEMWCGVQLRHQGKSVSTTTETSGTAFGEISIPKSRSSTMDSTNKILQRNELKRSHKLSGVFALVVGIVSAYYTGHLLNQEHQIGALKLDDAYFFPVAICPGSLSFGILLTFFGTKGARLTGDLEKGIVSPKFYWFAIPVGLGLAIWVKYICTGHI